MVSSIFFTASRLFALMFCISKSTFSENRLIFVYASAQDLSILRYTSCTSYLQCTIASIHSSFKRGTKHVQKYTIFAAKHSLKHKYFYMYKVSMKTVTFLSCNVYKKEWARAKIFLSDWKVNVYTTLHNIFFSRLEMK